MGLLAKTDALYARLLALFGDKVQPPLRPIVQGNDRLLADLVARRRQLLALVVAEKNRLGIAPPAIRRLIASLLRTLEKHLRALDQQIGVVLLEDPDRAVLHELL